MKGNYREVRRDFRLNATLGLGVFMIFISLWARSSFRSNLLFAFVLGGGVFLVLFYSIYVARSFFKKVDDE